MTIQIYTKNEKPAQIHLPVFPKVNRSLMNIRSSKGIQITGSSIKFTGHSHTPQRRCSDSYWSFGPVMNNLLLDKPSFYWTLPHVRHTLGMTDLPSKLNIYEKKSHPICKGQVNHIYVTTYVYILIHWSKLKRCCFQTNHKLLHSYHINIFQQKWELVQLVIHIDG
jgi:hypothetical protein